MNIAETVIRIAPCKKCNGAARLMIYPAAGGKTDHFMKCDKCRVEGEHFIGDASGKAQIDAVNAWNRSNGDET